ncbi:MAG: 2-dehydropantoate 2-reductase [Spirochaetes bacterium]|nr:2-dehydropantoate 2-reductase [Spirochaetota bacterium]
MTTAGIVGAGAMGALFSCFFHRAGVEFRVYEKDRATVEALKNGLRARLEDGAERVVPLAAGSDPAAMRECGIVFIFVKSHATRAAAADIAPHLKEGTIVVSLQNGLGNREILARELPGARLVYGTTTIGGYKDGAGSVVLGGLGEIVIGSGDDTALAEARGLLEKAGLAIIITPNPEEAVWKKALINAGINPLGALSGLENGKIIGNEHLATLMESIIREGAAAASAEGVSLDPDEMIETALQVCARTARNRCSMLQDLDAGRHTEIDSINGHIIRTGLKHGIRSPFNEAVYRLVKSREG